MWQPPQRIRHELADTRWPTAVEAQESALFESLALGPLTLSSRTWVPAMVPWRATEEGFVSDDVVTWYARFAEGKPGAIVVEATGIRDVPSGPLLRAGHPRFIPGLARIVKAVKEVSDGQTAVFIQLIDFLQVRRRPTAEKFFARFLAVTQRHREKLAQRTGDARWATCDEGKIRDYLAGCSEDELDAILSKREGEDLRRGYRERVGDMHLPHIRKLPQTLPGLFADAAQNVVAAGFDGVELHYAHAYTMASFLSALNNREDGYGGSRENRVRLPLQVIAAVRDRIGTEAALGLRFLGDEAIVGGSNLGDALYYGLKFAEAGVDFLSVSKGGKFEDAKAPKVGKAVYPYTGPSGYECMPSVYSDERGPFGRNVNLAKEVKRAINEAGYQQPVIAAGGIGTFAMAEEILQRQEADVIASARQSLADPDWFRKVKLGRGDCVRRCEYTNYCEGLDQHHKQVTCKLWDRQELDAPEVSTDKSGRRRLLAPVWREETIEDGDSDDTQ